MRLIQLARVTLLDDDLQGFCSTAPPNRIARNNQLHHALGAILRLHEPLPLP